MPASHHWASLGVLFWTGVQHAALAYPLYPGREVVVLNPWTRTFANGSAADVDLPDSFAGRGVVSYSRALPPRERRALLRFTCSLRCELFVDGRAAAENNSTYLPVFVELPAAARSLRLAVDSQFLGRHSTHQLQYDWWQPGGIFSPIELHLLQGSAFLRNVRVYPTSFPRVLVDIEAPAGLDLALSFDGGQPVGPVPAKSELAVPSPRPWSPASPELHHLAVYLLDGGRVQDVVLVRFGLRQVTAHSGRVHVNGEPVRLLGVNRHHMGPQGVIVTSEDISVDIAHIKNLGGNFLRGAHYPQDARVLDTCDEEGVLVWEETLAWQNTVEELTNDTWLETQKMQIRRMLEHSANHPSVIIYGFLNEGRSDHPFSKMAYKALADEVRGLDVTRLVGWASSVTIRDLAWEFADVIGFNDYSGWYRSTVDATVEELQGLPHIWKFYHDWVVEHFPGKPLIASEFGAGAIAGQRGSGLKKWTEECQSVLVQLHLLGALHSDLAGACVWSLADFPVDPTTDAAYRPHGRNDKGLLSVGRTPKLAYGAVAAIFRGHRGLLLEEGDYELFKDVLL